MINESIITIYDELMINEMCPLSAMLSEGIGILTLGNVRYLE